MAMFDHWKLIGFMTRMARDFFLLRVFLRWFNPWIAKGITGSQTWQGKIHQKVNVANFPFPTQVNLQFQVSHAWSVRVALRNLHILPSNSKDRRSSAFRASNCASAQGRSTEIRACNMHQTFSSKWKFLKVIPKSSKSVDAVSVLKPMVLGIPHFRNPPSGSSNKHLHMLQRLQDFFLQDTSQFLTNPCAAN